MFSINDDLENVRAMSGFIREKMTGVRRIDLLPYHSMGEAKCGHIGKQYLFRAPYEMDRPKVETLRDVLKTDGFQVTIEG